MKTLIVPTDFSDASKNAALYAVQFAKQTSFDRIVLYHSFEKVVAPDPLMGYAPVEMSDEKESADRLIQWKADIQKSAGGITLEVYHSSETLEKGIDHICKMMDAELVVMGMKGGSKVKEVLIGSNTLRMARHLTIPLIIVPAKVKFTPINEVLLAVDFRQTDSSYNLQPVKNLVQATHALLFVLNIMKMEQHPDEHQPDTTFIDKELNSFSPHYNFLRNDDYVQAMNEFAYIHQVDLIITFPKKHGWLEELLKPSHTRQLAYHSHVPLMVVH